MRSSATLLVTAATLLRTSFAHSLDTRGTNCGPAYGGAVCDAGQCCSSAGVCGAGSMCIAPDCLFQYGPACDANQNPKGPDTSSLARPQFGSAQYGVTINKCTVPGKVALTFDDGPWKYTSDVLDLLKANNVKATFFVVGNNGGKGHIDDESTGYPAILRRTINEGHQIGSHTWSHQDLSTINDQQITDQVLKNEVALASVFGYIPTYFRPPYGRCYGSCLSILGKYGYHVINWNLDTNDWKEDYDASRAAFSGAIKNSNPSNDNFIVLSHDIHYGTVHGLVQYMLDTLKSAGYSTATVGECLGDPPSNWYRDAKSGQQQGGNAAPTTSSPPPPPPPSTTSTTSTMPPPPPSTSSSTQAARPATTSTSSSSKATTSSHQSSTSSTIHATTTIIQAPPHLNVTLGNTTSAVGSSGLSSTSTPPGCSGNIAACVMQGLGATTSAGSNPASSTTQAGASAVQTGASSRLEQLWLQALVPLAGILALLVYLR